MIKIKKTLKENLKKEKTLKSKEVKNIDVLENISNEIEAIDVNFKNDNLFEIENIVEDKSKIDNDGKTNIIGKLNVNGKEININSIEDLSFIQKDLIKNDKKSFGIKKTNIIYDILSSKTGATLNELMAKTGWQKHSIRGTLSNLQKDLQFTLIKVVVSRPDPFNSKNFIKETRYFIKDEFFVANDLFNKENDNTIENQKMITNE